jgi:PPOX class probable F420-dependent enzyme
VTPREAQARFASAQVARLATVTPGGRPHVVPVTFALDGDTIYTAIDAKPKRGTPLQRLANIAANPHVALLVDEYDDDWERLWWVRADGLASVEPTGPKALSLLRNRYAQYREVEITGPLIIVRIDRWVGWSADRKS